MIADIIISLDNVIAVAAAANGEIALLVLGLAISIPMIIAGAALIMLVLDRFPILIWLGAALLGWIAGDVIETDPAIRPILDRAIEGKIALGLDASSAIFGWAPHIGLNGDIDEYICSVLGAVAVLVAGSIWRRRALRRIDQLVKPVVDEPAQPTGPA